ncbi:MAG: hypothetical protein IJA02_11560 [Clostridia bacterium]|nr:hypothetical protein [Clostridia bacterium]
MEIIKKVLLKLLFPHVAVVAALVPVAAALLIYAFAAPNANEVLVYASYVVSAYALTVVCTKAPAIFKFLKNLKSENKFISRYYSDGQLRIKLSLYMSVAINLLYALLQLGMGIYYRSVWFYALFGYYALLGLMRFFLLKETVQKELGKNIFRELLHYRFCGILLLLMNITLGVIVSYIVFQNRGFEHHYIITIAMAAYTFISVAIAIRNVVKYRCFNSPVMSAAKAISLAAALVSVLSLETAMLSAFGTDTDEKFRRIITAATGLAVCAAVLSMAVYMIIFSTKKLNLIKKGN